MSVSSTIDLRTRNDNSQQFPDVIVHLNRAIRAVGSEWSASFCSEVMTTMDDAVHEIERLRSLVSQYRIERGRIVAELGRIQIDLFKLNSEALKHLQEVMAVVLR
jgi:hypothetical protein